MQTNKSMTETEKYTAKENAKSSLQSALQDYIRAAEDYGYADCEMAAEIEDVLADCGKKWDVLHDA